MGKEIYIIVTAPASHIEELVNIKIREGYAPLGGISITSTGGQIHFYQAMILKEYSV